MNIKKSSAALLVALGLMACLASAAIIDPTGTGPDDGLLRSMAEKLDQSGLDVVLGKASDYAAPEKPRLASLKGYAPKQQDWGTFVKAGWSMAFERSLAGVIFAYRPGSIPDNLEEKKSECETVKPPEDEEACRFVTDWLAANPEERVFVAFTNEDFAAALEAKQAFEKSGYVVFMFLKGKNEKPWASAAVVGEVFAQATHRLVIDTKAARGSAGVRFESLCCEPHLLPPYPKNRWAQALANGK